MFRVGQFGTRQISRFFKRARQNRYFTVNINDDANMQGDVPMASFKVVDLNGKEYHVEAYEGETLLDAGVRHGVPFEKACGGNAECVTCH